MRVSQLFSPTSPFSPQTLAHAGSRQENNSVTELREKIKTFLASQGMIKGHSGSGPRSNDGDPPVLVLVENLQAQPTSPPTPTLSAGLNEPPRQSQGPTTSYVRDPRDPTPYHHQPPMPQSEQQQHSYAPQSQQSQQPQTSMYSSMFSYNPLGSNFVQPGLPIFQN